MLGCVARETLSASGVVWCGKGYAYSTEISTDTVVTCSVRKPHDLLSTRIKVDLLNCQAHTFVEIHVVCCVHLYARI